MSAPNGRPRVASSDEMRGKTVVISGASSGIGLASAKALAAKGARTVMLCRDPSRAESASAHVGRVSSGQWPLVVLVDFADQAQIRAAVEELCRLDGIDVLINNAGAIFSRRELTVDGIERTFAVNHLAPFLLTNLLSDRLRAGGGARVVTVVSERSTARSSTSEICKGSAGTSFSAHTRRRSLRTSCSPMSSRVASLTRGSPPIR